MPHLREVLGLGCGLSNPQRFYHTRGHYPGHTTVSGLCLVVEALRNFPHFDDVAIEDCSLRLACTFYAALKS